MKATRIHLTERTGKWITSLIIASGLGLVSGCATHSKSESNGRLSNQELAAGEANENPYWGYWDNGPPGWPF